MIIDLLESFTRCMMSNKIYGRVCLVTGGGSGIGRSLCERLASSGARAVVVADINPNAASAVASSLTSMATHPNFRAGDFHADVGKEDDVRGVLRTTVEEHGSLDAYFSNAGILAFGGADAAEVSNGEWERMWRVNVMSHVYAARYLFPMWRERSARRGARRGGRDDADDCDSDDGNDDGRGIFVVTASAAGLLAQPGSLPYTVTKHAAVAIADYCSIHDHDCASIHCLCPQAVRTPMLTSNAPEGASEDDIPIIAATADGALDPRDVVDETLRAINEGRYLVLPHPEVKTYSVRRAEDPDRWIRGMRKFQQMHVELIEGLGGKHKSKM